MSYYAGNGLISRAPVAGGIEISETEYRTALAGMLAGLVVSIEDGALIVRDPPEPEPEPVPEPTATEIAERRIADIDARLAAIDIASVRALRATVAGTATEADAAYLTALETEAAGLRSERAELAVSLPVEGAES